MSNFDDLVTEAAAADADYARAKERRGAASAALLAAECREYLEKRAVVNGRIRLLQCTLERGHAGEHRNRMLDSQAVRADSI